MLTDRRLASMILWRSLLNTEATFVGDLIVLIYLLMMPALAVILGSFASRNPLASIGGSREIKLMIAYELPLVLAVVGVVIQAGTMSMQGIVEAHSATLIRGRSLRATQGPRDPPGAFLRSLCEGPTESGGVTA